MPRLGIALGGGGTRGFAHVGVLKALESHQLAPSLIAGTSAGSVVGALYASGMTGFKLQETSFALDEARLKDLDLFGMSRGLVKGQKLQDYINELVNQRTLEQLGKPFVAVATDLDSGQRVIFARGNTGQAVRASCSIPGLFQPVEIAGKRYVDGGVVSPVPVDAVRQLGADLVIAVGTRLQDFTTGSNRLFAGKRVLGINISALDARKCDGNTLVADAAVALAALDAALHDWKTDSQWNAAATQRAAAWLHRVDQLTRAEVLPAGVLPYDADVIGAVRDSTADSAATDVVVCAAGTLPAELHKLWRSSVPGNYHVEYGYSCMGYEIAGGLGVKMARPQQEVIVMVGDGSYLNSEIATSVMLGLKLLVVVLDNRGFGCIQRLQTASGGAAFNNMLQDCAVPDSTAVQIDFAQHARSLGADAMLASNLDEFRMAMVAARAARKTQVIVINTTHTRTTDDGGCWWDVAIPEVSQRAQVVAARQAYDTARKDKSS